jgi:hypothetical protein
LSLWGLIPQTPTSTPRSTSSATFNQQYFRDHAKKVFRGQKARVLKGPVGPVPYGYRTTLVYDTPNSSRSVTHG